MVRLLLLSLLLCLSFSCRGQETMAQEPYTYKSGSPNGIGKWYMGREIAYVMGYQGMAWLERSEREAEEKTSLLLQNMNIQVDDTIVDIGAGSGYHVFKMATIASNGLVFAVDIQEEMLAAIDTKKQQLGVSNIELIQGSEKSINLPEESVDKILMVDVYHEFEFPVEMLASIKKALRDDGMIFLVEYRGEDPRVPIKKLHKMTEAQAVQEFAAAGFILQKNYSNLPWQHCMVFIKSNE